MASGAKGPADALRDFARAHPSMRESGFLRRILPPLEIDPDELDRSVPSCDLGILMFTHGYSREEAGKMIEAGWTSKPKEASDGAR